LGHTWSEWADVGTVVCGQDGTQERTCGVCSDTDTRTVDAADCLFETYTSNNNATCLTDGTKTAECERDCGETDTVTDTGTALGHDFGTSKNNGTHECKRDGCTVTQTCSPNTAGATCGACGYRTPSGNNGGGTWWPPNGGTTTPPTPPPITPPTTPPIDPTPDIFNADKAKEFAETGESFTFTFDAIAEITLNPDALTILADACKQDGSSVIVVEAVVVPMSDLKGMQAAQVKGYETVVSIDVFLDDVKFNVPLTVSLPYTLKANENPAAVRVWHMDDNGNLTCMNGVFDTATGMITFTITHQSYFVVGYDPVRLWVNSFTDIAESAWYYEAVAYANYHGLFSGYGGGIFAPQDSMTRAMFVTVLHKLEGNPAPSGSGRFADVAVSAWYHDPVQWASEQGIVSGVGDNRYAPDRPITRQEMAVMLMNYAKFKGYDMPVYREAINFTDTAQIASWANVAVKAMSEAGVLNGYNNAYNPLSTATRAEVAAMFKNFLRFVVEDNPGTNGTQTAAVSNTSMDLYIDRRAMEEIERALMAGANSDGTDSTI